MKTFEELELIPAVRRALAEEQYQTPTDIQAQAIPPALAGRDVLGCAQTGTGKTAAFALPVLNALGERNRKAPPNRPFVLVLAPTRELAVQIEQSFATYGRHLKLRRALVYGGVGQGKQVKALDRGAHVLVATPGRLLDLMNQGHVRLDGLETFVLDEADRMLDMGFLPDLRRIMKELPARRQSMFFSATLSPQIVELSGRLLTDPVSVDVTPETTSVEAIQQRVLFVERSGKKALLRTILGTDGVDRALVFTRTKRTANGLAQQLSRKGVRAAAIHGNKSQNARQRALDDFRRDRVNVLVATDVAARGIDVDGITHVVNFDLPVEPQGYVHRIGRTGRAGAEGVALSFCTADERGLLKDIERLIGQSVPVDRERSTADPADTAPRCHGGARKRSGKRSGPPRNGGNRPADASSNGDRPRRKRRRRRRGGNRQRAVERTN